MSKNKSDKKSKTPLIVTALILFLLLCGGVFAFYPITNFVRDFQSDKVSTTDIRGKSKEIAVKDIVVYTDKADYYSSENIEHIVRNNSDTKIVLTYPFYEIERYDETQQKWVQIKIRYECPCGADCRYATQLILQPKQFISNKWNQREEWCDGTQTVSNPIPLGKYRIVLNIADGSNISGSKVFSDVFFIFETIEYKLNQQGYYISQSGDILNNFAIGLSNIKMVSDTKAEFTVKNIRDLFIERIEFVLNYNEKVTLLEKQDTLLLKENLVEDVKLPPFTEKKVYIYGNFSDLKEHFSKSFIITPVVQAVWIRK